MRLLLDTHALLWWLVKDDQLSAIARAAIANRSNAVYVSAATGWELAMKQAKGHIRLPAPLMTAVDENDFIALAIDIEAAERACALPWHHRDPWDRLLIAQALQHDLTLVSRDAVFPSYGLRLLW